MTTTETRRLPRAARREAILAAAADVFAGSGFAATSVADISAAAGVSHLIVYRHYESKEELYRAVLQRAVEHLDAALAISGAVGRYGPTARAVLDSARRGPSAFTVLWRHAAREPAFVDTVEEAREHLLDATGTALTARVPRSQRRWAARATVAYLIEAVLVWIEDGDERLDRRFVTAADAATRAGVRAWSRPND